MDYEKLLKIAGSRLEEMDEQLRMLAPGDLGGGREGRAAYSELFATYNKFAETGDMNYFEQVADRLARVTGHRL